MSKDDKDKSHLTIKGIPHTGKPVPLSMLDPKHYPAVAKGYKTGYQAGVELFTQKHLRPGVGLSQAAMGGRVADFLHVTNDYLSFLDLKMGDLSPEQIEMVFEIKRKLEALPEKDRRRAYNELVKEHKKHRLKWIAERAQADADVAYMQRCLDASEENVASLTVHRVEKSMFNDLRQAARTDQVMYLTDPPSKYKDHAQISRDYERDVFKHAQVFMMQHDWAAGFANAKIEKETFRLPYEVCAFEFQIGGKRIIALCVQADSEVYACLAALTTQGWMIHDFGLDPSMASDEVAERVDNGTIFRFVMHQVRCCCIALDAEVAVSEVHREKREHSPHQKRDYSKAPPSSYHVVSLAKRTRAPRLEGGEPTGRHVRLHFRRGHWRHYEDHRTWIKWMLVGDPDLGFIDKHYKL